MDAHRSMIASILITKKTEAVQSKAKIISPHHFLFWLLLSALSPLTQQPFELHVKKENPLSYCTEPSCSLGGKVGQATASLLAGAGSGAEQRPAHPSLSAGPIHNSRSPTGNSFAPETRRLGAGVGRACVRTLWGGRGELSWMRAVDKQICTCVRQL